MSKDINKIFKQIQKESEQMAVNAMIEVQRELQAQIHKEAVNCLKQYYAYKPKIYKRIGGNEMALGRAFGVKAIKDSAVKQRSMLYVVLTYDSRRINGLHKSKSKFHQSGDKWVSRFDDPGSFNFQSGANGIPEAGWILKNYMEGVHPGAPWANDVVDSENTDEHMTSFFDKTLPGMVNDIAVKAMQNAVVNYLTK